MLSLGNGWCGEVLLDQFYDLIEALRVRNGHFGKHLAVQCNLGPIQAADELAVAEAPLTYRGIDTDDP